MKKLICILLALLLLAGCGAAPAETTALSDEEILAQRRQTVMDYMRSQLDFYWVCDETFEYLNTKTNKVELVYEAGKVYRGLPYGQAGGTTASFLRYSTGKDEKGIHQLSGLKQDPETGKFLARRLGSDCSSTLWNAWSQISPSISADKRTTKYLTEDNGVLRVGNYTCSTEIHAETKKVCRENGEQTMFEAYALLQPGDGCVHFNGTGHAIMITDVEVKRNAKTGEILGNTSFVKIMDQTSGRMNDGYTEYVEEVGCEVQFIGNVEKALSFSQMFSAGYLPITCKELIDPAPLAEEMVADSVKEYSADTLHIGTVTASYPISSLTMTITDAQGKIVQKATCYAGESDNRYMFRMSQFNSPIERPVMQGAYDPDALTAGSYHCTLTCQIATGRTFTVRSYDFTVE